jgi:hypothetical protein
MNAATWRTISYVVVFAGTLLVLAGSIGTWYFGNLVEAVAPFAAPIRSASATVEVVIRSNIPYDNFYMDRGGYIALSKNSEEILTVGAAQCSAKQLGNARALFRGVFQMDATDSAVGKPVRSLAQADVAQIEFLTMPKDAHVLEGRAIVTINNAVRVEISVPEQDIHDGKIFVRDIKNTFIDFR